MSGNVGVHLARRLLGGDGMAHILGELEMGVVVGRLVVIFSHHIFRKTAKLLIIKLIIPFL